MPTLPPGGSASGRVHLTLATDLSQVGAVVDTVCRYCDGHDGLSRRARFRLCTVLAEAVANAMLYGNAGDAARAITVDVNLLHDRLIVAVTDEGDGFDHRAVPLPFGEESLEATRGRGLYMIHRLADQVSFNERGNTIWMTLSRR